MRAQDRPRSVKGMTAVLETCSHRSVVPVDGTLRAPVGTALRRSVEALLDRGERRVVLDLARLSAIDAAGIGELMRVRSTTTAAGGVLHVARAGRRVRTLLRVTGVFALLSTGAENR